MKDAKAQFNYLLPFASRGVYVQRETISCTAQLRRFTAKPKLIIFYYFQFAAPNFSAALMPVTILVWSLMLCLFTPILFCTFSQTSA